MRSLFSSIDWQALAHSTMTRSLALSLALHVALIGLLRPAPGSEAKRDIVIHARLTEVVAQRSEETPPPPSEPDHTAPPEPRDTPPLEDEPPPLLTAQSPSPAPPIPQPSEEPLALADAPPALAPSPAPSPAPATVEADAGAGEVQAARAGPTLDSALPSLPLGIDDTWYIARQVDRHPKAIGKIEPIYPETARRGNLEGTLKLMLRIDPLGRVRDATVVEASPPGVFEEAALAAFRDARFEPALREGRPVRYEAYIRVDFRLSD